MKLSFLFTLIGSFLLTSVAGASDDDALYLVVGSTRVASRAEHFLNNKLWDTSGVDLSHLKSYDGKATTMDKAACSLSKTSHIIGDATKFNFTVPVMAAYLEKLPTEEERINVLGQCIQNIGHYMHSGAVMEVEWFPLIRYKIKASSTLEDIAQITRNDPFTGCFHLSAAKLAIAMVVNVKLDHSCSPEIKHAAVEMVPLIDDLLIFYKENGVGEIEDLKKRLTQELTIINRMQKNFKKVLLPVGPRASLEDFSESVKNIEYIDKHSSKIRYYGSDSKKAYNFKDFVWESFFNFIFSDITVILNKSLVEEFMIINGFKDVDIARLTSPYNNRKNVWIITGVKK